MKARNRLSGLGSLVLGVCLVSPGAASVQDGGAQSTTAPGTLEETRLALGKWIETQQIISRERNDWQQSKEVLLGRLEVVKQEIELLEKKIDEAEDAVADADRKEYQLLAQNSVLEDVGRQLTEAVTGMEAEVRAMFPALPEPIQTKLQPLHQRIPSDPTNTRVSVAERFQNVLGILNELNKANNEITVSYEVHTLGDGRPSEVKAIYVGLAQAYYVSGGGEAGIGRPTSEGWKWEPSSAAADDILIALEILEGKHTPAFVPLPVRVQ